MSQVPPIISEKKKGNFLLALARRVLLIFGAFLATLFYFMILPLLQNLQNPPDEDTLIRQAGVADKPPEKEETQQEEEKEEEKPPEPELSDAPAEPMDLSTLALAMEGGGLGGVGDGFVINLPTGVGGPQGAGGMFSLNELDEKPRAIYQPSPRYPRDLQQQGISGTVKIVFIVDDNGRVTQAKVLESTHPGFEREALKAVKRWKFEPGKRAGKPVQFRMKVPIKFSQG